MPQALPDAGGGGAAYVPPPPPPPKSKPPTTPTTSPPTPTVNVPGLPPGLPLLPDPTTWTGGLITQAMAKELVDDGYPANYVSEWQRAIENYLLASGKLTGYTVPVVPVPTPTPTPTPTPGGGGPIDPSSGDPAGDPGPEPTAADYDTWDSQDQLEAAGVHNDLMLTHPAPGTIIGTPYEGTHSKAFNIAGGSDNWQSENAVDVWLPAGTQITAIAPGTVSPPGWGFGLSAQGGRFAGYRLHLVIAGAPWVAFYTHLRSLVVQAGQQVENGQLLGYSGIANGVPHLHFALQPGFDPADYVKRAYDLSGTPAVGTPGVNTVPAGGGSSSPPADVGSVEDAWTQFAKVLAYTLPDATSHIKTARSQLGPAVN